MNIKQKIECALIMANMSQAELAKRIGTSQSNFSQRLKRGKFTDEELSNIAKALGATYYSGFLFPDGKKAE